MCSIDWFLWFWIQRNAGVRRKTFLFTQREQFSETTTPPPSPFPNRQPDVRTIEGELFSALVKAGAVSKDNADDPVKVGWILVLLPTTPVQKNKLEKKTFFWVT